MDCEQPRIKHRKQRIRFSNTSYGAGLSDCRSHADCPGLSAAYQSGLPFRSKYHDRPSSVLPLRLATQMRNSGDGNQDSTPDRQGEELAEIEEVECRRDHLQDDQRQDEPADFADAAKGIAPTENRCEDGDEQIALAICRIGRIEPCQHYHCCDTGEHTSPSASRVIRHTANLYCNTSRRLSRRDFCYRFPTFHCSDHDSSFSNSFESDPGTLIWML